MTHGRLVRLSAEVSRDPRDGFVARAPETDQLSDGRRFGIPAILDDFTRDCVALVADTCRPGSGSNGSSTRSSSPSAASRSLASPKKALS
jgi:hypothetical protein